MEQLKLPLKFKEEKKDHWLKSAKWYDIILDVTSTITWDSDSVTIGEDDWRIIR